MSITARPFQQATIKAALKTLTRKNGPRRFLVADEVGLGKTIVASGVIQSLSIQKRKHSDQPLCVLYVCSNLAIAKQNIARLINFMPEDERKKAIAAIDRPSLLPTQEKPNPDVAVNIFSLTPSTAIPTRKGQRQDGRMEERALALVLLLKIAPSGINGKRLYRVFRRLAGKSSFKALVRNFTVMEKSGKLGGTEFRRIFNESLRETLGLKPGQHLPPRISQMQDDKDQHSDLIGATRTALALAGLRSLSADLVIFDEFQRFRDLTDESSKPLNEDNEDRLRDRAAKLVLKEIRGGASEGGPALLLLSATPYTPYREKPEKDQQDNKTDQNSDFFHLVSFLSDNPNAAKNSRMLFGELSNELRKGQLNSLRAIELRDTLISTLSPLISRTERPRLPNSSGTVENETKSIYADLLPCDMKPFHEMHSCFLQEDQSWVVPLWQSVPLPMQTLGSRYLAWSRKGASPEESVLTTEQRDAHKTPVHWPHPKLRALMSELSQTQMTLPWLAPSMPWWPLQDGWKESDKHNSFNSKLLVFSRFRAVPTALAGIISYTTESRLLSSQNSRKKISYKQVSQRRWLQPTPDRPGFLMELFHPSPFLSDLEPLAAPLGNFRRMKEAVVQQLRNKLSALDIRVFPGKSASRARAWELLAAIEKKAGLWDMSISAWSDISKDKDVDLSTLSTILQRWDIAANKLCTSITENDLSELASLSLESPGVAMLRALRRHWPDAASEEHFKHIVSVAWKGLRNYLDNSLFAVVLSDRDTNKYPAAIRKATISGNLESVLDEHFWYLSTDGSGDWHKRLDEFEASLGLRDANVTFQDPASRTSVELNESSSFNLRCHVAVPLTEGRSVVPQVSGSGRMKDSETPIRSDEIRKAFNSPFWPNVLVTTSIGQEGIDLHPWCNALAHWDLATSPVALEQREGRITRFASLSVRKAIAAALREDLVSAGTQYSPWVYLAALAEVKLKDESGLSPWWITHGAKCRKLFVSVPGSELQERYDSLARERALYRLVLGMPDQDGLMSILDAQSQKFDPADIRKACIDLSAYNISKDKS